MYTTSNETGTINLGKGVIGSIVIDITDKLQNKVLLCNPKGKSGISEKKNLTFLEVNMTDNELYIKIYLLMRFGASISATTSQIIDAVKTSVKTALGIEPKTVSLIIKGVVSKNVSKRNIEVIR